MRRGNTLGTVVIGLLLLLTPAGRACLAFQPMAGDCPMPMNAATPDRLPSGLEHSGHAMDPTAVAEGHEHGAEATAPAAPCHDEQEPAAACCRTGTAPGEVQGASFGSTEQPAPLAAQPVALAADAIASNNAIVHFGSRRRPPEPPRYELLSSYLL